MTLLFLLLFCLGALADETANRAVSPTVIVLSPDATIVGLPGLVETFCGIPFAQPPAGLQRFKPPQPLAVNESLGTINAFAVASTCPQNLVDQSVLPEASQEALAGLLGGLVLPAESLILSEDCLYLNVYRPPGIDASAKLPVLFWMHGGGFEMGFTMTGEGSSPTT